MQHDYISSEGIGVIRGIQVFILYNLSWITMETAPVKRNNFNSFIHTTFLRESR